MSEHPPVSMRLIVRCVAEELGVPERYLYAQRRDAVSVEARQMVYWLARRFHGGSLTTIGRALGRDHTTVLHGARESEARRVRDPAFAARLDRLAATVSYLANQQLAQRLVDPDPVAVAERVICASDPLGRGVDRVSAIEFVAVCGRLLALEELAAGTFRLLADLDEAERADRAGDGPRVETLLRSARALTESVASTLAALGYAAEPASATQPEHDHEPEKQDSRLEPAGAADPR